ncbi:hypothetical protein AKJ09_01720 [Labilithrix luteola]|uniref:Uncharacterized protein n=1 Tax=Labilithrix luteola TaxID=1391654 RepID=A0A0K1PNS7_9BACT|nr:hypothetical protein [Labilithrix luteola]AKU95056.1 hypothetical protein AKJ09_01720 [Labilithrix luteola]
MSWSRLTSVLEKYDGALIPIAEDAIHPAYVDPLPTEPRLDIVLERRPDAYARFVAANGYSIVSTRGRNTSFAFLPPKLAARVTRAMGEPGRSWEDVTEERAAGRSQFAWVMFAAYDLSDVNGWAFGPGPDATPVVWSVEDSVPCEMIGTFDEWLAIQADELERQLMAVQKVLEQNESASDDDWTEVDDAVTAIEHF